MIQSRLSRSRLKVSKIQYYRMQVDAMTQPMRVRMDGRKHEASE